MKRIAATLTPERPVLFSVVLSAGYALAFLIQRWPQALRFWSHSWLDDGDGLVMVWNVWLARMQGLNFWSTDFVFAPEGTSLLIHTYAPLKGWIAALLPLPLTPSVNLLILLSFALAGTFSFWLARRFSASLTGCILAGYAFTFTGFHWAHAQGHLNLLSTELLPLYALVWLRYEERPNWARASVVAGVLLATALTDYYFAIYCGILTLVYVVETRMRWSDMARVAALVIPTSGALALAVMIVMRGQKPLGAHNPLDNPLDPVSLVVPGGHWRFAEWTRLVWERYPGGINEHSVHIGIAVLIAIVWRARSRRWWVVFGVFFVLALGERLAVLGHSSSFPFPYGVLEWLIPPLALGAVPVRMVVMVALAAAILFSMAWPRLGRARIPLAALLVLELWPSPGPATRVEVPGWVDVLAQQEGRGALYDPYSEPKLAMAYQVRHHHPISGGALARTPERALALNDARFDLFVNHSVGRLADLGFDFILSRGYPIGGATLLWEHNDERLYQMAAGHDSNM